MNNNFKEKEKLKAEIDKLLSENQKLIEEKNELLKEIARLERRNYSGLGD